MEKNLLKNPNEKMAVISSRLEEYFGVPKRPENLNPLEVLVETILSQNTNDQNCDIAFQRLKQAFPDWEKVENAPVDSIEEAIRPAGLARQKAPRIKQALRWIHNTYGSLNLDFICNWPPEKVLRTLSKLNGVGVKTISVVLMLACSKDVFPVDTHIHRITRRVGLISEKTSAEKAHHLLKEWIPKGKAFSLHINMLKLGRSICNARRPKCETCPIRDVCDYYESNINLDLESLKKLRKNTL